MAKKEIIIAENRDFKGVWIPERLYLTREFTPNEKFLLIEIYSLTKKKSRECFANNKHFADFVGLKENTVQKMMLKFENAGYIKRDYEYREGTKEIERRTIKLTQKFYEDFINESETPDSSADDMENNQGEHGFESIDEVDKNPQGNGLKVGEKYNNFKSNNNLSNTDLSNTPNSFSNEKDNSKPNGLELYNSEVGELRTDTPEPEETNSPKVNITMTLGKRERPSRKHELQDMPTRAKEIAYRLTEDEKLSDKTFDCVKYFIDCYKANRGREHVNLRNDTIERVVTTMLSTITVPVDGKDGDYFENDYSPLICHEVDKEDFEEVIDKYFATDFSEKTDYSIVHFLNENVLPKIMNKCSVGNGYNWYESHEPY